jgi:DHA2 family multidrug resistance protein-like MFS transporter
MSFVPTNGPSDMAAAETPKAGRREWIGLGVIALPCLLYSMDLTVLNVAIPQISADLKPSSSQLLWIIDIYGFLVAGFLITMGTLGDRIGRRRLLLIGAAAFGVGSLLAAFSNSAEMLIVARALLGVAGATLAPSTLSLIFNMFHDPHQRTVAIAVWVASYSAGAVIGPVVGGLMLEFFWWGSVFLLAIPVMLLLLALGPLLLPEFRNPEAGRVDLPSVALSLAAVLAIIYGLKQIAQDGLDWLPALSILVGAALGLAFVRRQQTLTDPMIDLHLFRIRAFSASLLGYALSIGVVFGAFVFILQYLQLVQGLSALRAGFWMVPSGLAFIAGGMLTPLLVRRFRAGFVMAAGLALSAAGFVLLALVDENSGAGMVVLALIIFSVGLTPMVTLATDLIVGAAPRERAGAASAISETGAEFGGALGIAILGSIGIAVYRGRLADAVPSGVAPEQAEIARDTLGGATEVAEQLPAEAGAALLDTAREAFIQGVQVTAVTGAVVLAGLSVLIAVLLRDVRPATQETIDQPAPRRGRGARARSRRETAVPQRRRASCSARR